MNEILFVSAIKSYLILSYTFSLFAEAMITFSNLNDSHGKLPERSPSTFRNLFCIQKDKNSFLTTRNAIDFTVFTTTCLIKDLDVAFKALSLA